MELVFIHGWGFDACFWDALSELLPKYKQRRVDLGFFDKPSDVVSSDDPQVLVGHSLGFIHGIKQKQNWHSWVAINSFPRFVRTDTQPGCATAAELRELRTGLATDSATAMEVFYETIESYPPKGTPNIERLRSGLDELRDTDVGNILQELEIPGLVLASRNDPLVPPKVSENLCGLVRNGVLLWNEAGGHTLPIRDAVWCAQAIEDFLG